MKNYIILDIEDVTTDAFNNLSDEAQLDGIETALETVSEAINDIYEQQDKLFKLRNKINARIIDKKAAKFNIQEGSIIVGFAKHMNYHYTMVKAYVVTKTYKKLNKFTVVDYTYRMDDGDINYVITKKDILRTTIFDMCDEFYVCQLNEEGFAELKNLMSELGISEKEFANQTSYFWSKAINQYNSLSS